MAKKTLTIEVLATVKGLDPKQPGEYVHAGTPDNPTLVELPDTSASRDLIASGAVRIWPGPQAAPVAPPKAADLKSLQKAAEVLPRLAERYRQELASAGGEDARGIEALIADAEADLALVREALK